MIIEGSISIKAAIKANRRNIECLYIDSEKKTKDFNYIRFLCHDNNIRIKELNKKELAEILSGNSHGGIGALVSKRKEDEFSDDDIFFLNGIEDPYNLGYCLRTLYAFGIKNVLLNDRDYNSIDSQLLKSSAGAYDFLNIKYIKDDLRELKQYQDLGYHLYSLYRNENSKDIFDVNFKEKSLIILGGEKRGIAKSIIEMSNETIYIPYASAFRNSLNAAAALDVVATLLYRQKKI